MHRDAEPTTVGEHREASPLLAESCPEKRPTAWATWEPIIAAALQVASTLLDTGGERVAPAVHPRLAALRRPITGPSNQPHHWENDPPRSGPPHYTHTPEGPHRTLTPPNPPAHVLADAAAGSLCRLALIAQ